jgi:hypothetical protein
MEASDFETKFSGNYGEALLKVPSITIICKVMAFAKIPLMIENHSRYKANKDKRQR